MTEQTRQHDEGPWTRVRNLAADATGSIHDDAAARRRGLPGGLVPGNVQLVMVQRGVVDRLGPEWYERGTLAFRWSRPVYDGEELRLVLTREPLGSSDERAVGFVLRKRDGNAAAAGNATLARSPGDIKAPWEREPPPLPREDARDPLPDESVGHEYRPKTLAIDADDVDRTLADLDPCPWYRSASPWGDAILPMAAFLPITGQGRRPASGAPGDPAGARVRIPAGMNGALDLVQTGPMFVGRPYLRRSVLVAKGYTPRTAFRTVEISLHDGDDRRVAVARWRANWFPQVDDATA